VSVAVDESGSHQTATTIGRLAAGSVAARPGPSDPAVLYQHGAVFDQAIGAIIGHRRESKIGKKHRSHLYKVVYTV
jgi:hypothetical protein